jgi:hypothetical protein
MTTGNEETKSEGASGTEDSRWGQLLAGLIFIVTGLLIFGFIWQSVESFLFSKW